tara:strand:- start:1605 stop:2291 length:687 start_codon:yes stop_codon:yes gene_type:complete
MKQRNMKRHRSGRKSSPKKIATLSVRKTDSKKVNIQELDNYTEEDITPKLQKDAPMQTNSNGSDRIDVSVEAVLTHCAICHREQSPDNRIRCGVKECPVWVCMDDVDEGPSCYEKTMERFDCKGSLAFLKQFKVEDYGLAEDAIDSGCKLTGVDICVVCLDTKGVCCLGCIDTCTFEDEISEAHKCPTCHRQRCEEHEDCDDHELDVTKKSLYHDHIVKTLHTIECRM